MMIAAAALACLDVDVVDGWSKLGSHRYLREAWVELRPLACMSLLIVMRLLDVRYFRGLGLGGGGCAHVMLWLGVTRAI
jgi:hypothetical protein